MTEDDIRQAAEILDADLAAKGIATFTPEQIREFQRLADERDVIERARLCQEMGQRVLREAEESMRRYEEVRKQCEDLGIDLSGAELDGDAMRARERAAQDYAERAEREVAAEARRLFGSSGGGDAAGGQDESAARVLSRGVGRMRV